MKKFLNTFANCIGYMVFKYKMKVAIFDAFNHGDEWINMFTQLAISCKGMTAEDIQKMLVTAIADKVHESNQSNKE